MDEWLMACSLEQFETVTAVQPKVTLLECGECGHAYKVDSLSGAAVCMGGGHVTLMYEFQMDPGERLVVTALGYVGYVLE